MATKSQTRLSTKPKKSYNEWELVLKMNHSLRMISVKRKITLTFHDTQDMIKFHVTSEDMVERPFLPWGLSAMMSVEKISKKFPVGFVILPYFIQSHELSFFLTRTFKIKTCIIQLIIMSCSGRINIISFYLLLALYFNVKKS